MKKQTYLFFFERNNVPYVIAAIDCKIPIRTKVYKELTNLFNIGTIKGYGYTVAEKNNCATTNQPNKI